MKLTNHQLRAFFETAKLRSFSKAAEELNVTQSALSQRVSNLEGELETTLFIRDTSGPILTESGEMLFRYCQFNDTAENEVLVKLKSGREMVSGVIRIAGFSSVLRSVIIPSLAPFLRKHPHVQCEFRSYEVIELYEILKMAKTDLVILDYNLKKDGIVEEVLGQEEYVVIESSKFEAPSDIYLDHGPHDNATESFFRFQDRRPTSYRRTFMGDVYGILNGVELGLGRAVMSKHLLKGNNKVKIVKGYKKYCRDITLNYYEQPYYPHLHKLIIEELKKCSIQFF